MASRRPRSRRFFVCWGKERALGGYVRIIIVAGGSTPSGEVWRRWVREGDRMIGADGGASHALARGLTLDLVIGDMDSLADGDRALLQAEGCQFVVHPRAKDQTDLELALTYAAGEGASEIVVLGAFGGRLDHTLANVLLLGLPQLEQVLVWLVDDRGEMVLAQSGRRVTVEGHLGDLVSLLPLAGDASGVTTTGLAWELEGDSLCFGSSRGVSNEMTAPEACIEVEEGLVLVVHGRSLKD
jgi:thiamine pyrophosphokinase